MMKEIHYKGYVICFNFYRRGEFTVYFDGDDVCFANEEDARSFIDDIVSFGQ